MTPRWPFARRADWPLASNALSVARARLNDRCVPVFDLTESNPTRCRFSYLDRGLVASLADEKNLCYAPEPRGNFQAREAVSLYYRDKTLDVSPDRIFLTSSTSEGYAHVFRLLVNPGERVIFPRPSYPLFSFLGDLNDVAMGTYPLLYDNGWRMDVTQLEKAITPETKAVVVVNPNNPTGSFVKDAEAAALNAVCQKRRLALISDEVFWDYPFKENTPRASLVNNQEALTFVVGGISKALGLPQMKLSWIVLSGPEDLVQAAGGRLEVIADTYLSVNTPAQHALAGWMSLRQKIQEEIRARVSRNWDVLAKSVSRAKGCELLAAQGGWYAVVRIPDVHGEEEWVLNFLEKDHVFVHPGYFFDFGTGAHIVLSLLPVCEDFQQGVTRLLERIRAAGVS